MTTNPATDKQLSFIKTLRAERYPEATTDELLAMRGADAKLDKSAASKLIESLLAMPKPAKADTPVGAAVASAAAVIYPATEKQINFIMKLWDERYGWQPEAEEVKAAVLASVQKMSKPQASAKITELLAVPKPKKVTPEEAAVEAAPADAPENPYPKVAEKGDVHYVDGAYYRIHMTQYSKKPYAAKAVILSKAVWNDEGTKILKAGRVQWLTAKGMLHELSNDTKCSPEEAHAFGKMVGRCCFCSLPIDTPESVSAGYGPVCATNKGLPWGAVIA